jgi:hypothetical protein
MVGLSCETAVTNAGICHGFEIVLAARVRSAAVASFCLSCVRIYGTTSRSRTQSVQSKQDKHRASACSVRYRTALRHTFHSQHSYHPA